MYYLHLVIISPFALLLCKCNVIGSIYVTLVGHSRTRLLPQLAFAAGVSFSVEALQLIFDPLVPICYVPGTGLVNFLGFWPISHVDRLRRLPLCSYCGHPDTRCGKLLLRLPSQGHLSSSGSVSTTLRQVLSTLSAQTEHARSSCFFLTLSSNDVCACWCWWFSQFLYLGTVESFSPRPVSAPSAVTALHLSEKIHSLYDIQSA